MNEEDFMNKLRYPFLTMMILGSAQLSQASEVRDRSLVCSNETQKIKLSLFPHKGALALGKIDLLVEVQILSKTKYTYLVNSLSPRLNVKEKGAVSYYFKNGDITIDLKINADQESATIAGAEDEKIQLTCSAGN